MRKKGNKRDLRRVYAFRLLPEGIEKLEGMAKLTNTKIVKIIRSAIDALYNIKL